MFSKTLLHTLRYTQNILVPFGYFKLQYYINTYEYIAEHEMFIETNVLYNV